MARLALALTLTLAACGSTRFSGTPGTAVIVYESGRESDAAAARRILEARGWAADVAPAGPAHRTRSSVAIYGQRHRVGRGTDLADALRPAIGDLDLLPFLVEGPGRHDAVVWLAAR